ncbi:MAG TPA: hypothetical protein VHB73_01930, partial [Alphaproteobacteria bacterium]|nr:hypothetical protein [Alphaproteobacteria bacterium]
MNPDYVIGGNNPHILYADASAGKARGSDAARPDMAADSSDAGPGAPPTADHELSFKDIFDIINPLQHIPIVSSIYRAVTGDQISGFAEVAGGALFGGPIGLVSGVVNAAVSEVTGKGAGETFLADLFGGDDGRKSVQMASSDPPPDEDKTLDAQIASAMPPGAKDQTLETQLASATLPPQAPAAAKIAPRQPYGGVMDMASNTAGQGAPNVLDNKVAEASPDDAARYLQPAPNAEGLKFYPLSKARRQGAVASLPMPINTGPDVRLKSVTRQATNAPKPLAAAVPVASAAKPPSEEEA